MSTARLFFALWPDAPLRAAMGESSREVLAECGGRPVAPANYHLTLAFLGDVAADRVPDIRTAAAGIQPPALALQLDCCGYFPRARVLWIGPTAAPAALAALAGRLWAALEPLGLFADGRGFRPHVTIARKVSRAPRSTHLPAVDWPARGFALIRSVTTSAGARYAVDQYFPEGSSNEP